jgi:ribonuclease BN (tRNA processing enzyme)
MDKIIFLGTGGGRNVLASQQRYTAGRILKLNDHQFHLDPGPGALIRSLEFGLDPKKTTALFVSHKHIDHCNDANLLINILTHGGINKRSRLFASHSFKPDTSIAHSSILSWLEKVTYLSAGDRTKIDNCIIEALPTKHTDELGIGFKFHSNDHIITYTSDTDMNSKIMKSYEGSDIIIFNCERPFIDPLNHHLSSQKVVDVINEVRPKLAILTHFGKKMLESNPLYEAREIQKLTGVQTIAAHDGLMIDPMSYSAASAQKKLSGY